LLFIVPPFVTGGDCRLHGFERERRTGGSWLPARIEDELDNTLGTRVTLRESFQTIFRHPLVWFLRRRLREHRSCAAQLRSDVRHVLQGAPARRYELEAALGHDHAEPDDGDGDRRSIGAGIIPDKLFKGARSPVAMGLYFLERIVITLRRVAMFSGLIKPGAARAFS
jgi:hypothetical protein